MIGKRLLHYEILDTLGSGGMGVVYRARDTKLGREVALKVLPADMAANPDRRARFHREAMAVAALKHPHIVTIYSVEEGRIEGGADVVFITMELMDGEALDRLIPPQGLNLPKLLDFAIPITEAVAYAHRKGITHRDLKPGNIMLDEAGRPKVLDFGLAKLLERAVDTEGATLAADGSVTREGTVIGTASYMSPEQAEGKPTDARSDVFSLGIILYEMATGQKPFQGETTISTISSILKDTPKPVTELNRSLPNHLGRVVNRCLAKDPARRYQVAHDLKNELDGLREESSGVGVVPPALETGLAPETPGGTVGARSEAGRRSRKPLVGGVTGAAVLAVLVAVWQPWSRGNEAPGDAPAVSAGADVGAGHERKMAVVLPFENLGPPEDAYFAAGMTEEITNRLGTVGGLGVISRTSAVGYDRTGKTMKEIGQDLGVDYVLEGTVRWAKGASGEGQVRISPKLVRVADDLPIWSETYDRQMTDIFEIQSDIAGNVVRELGVTLDSAERERLDERPTESLEAYQAYLQAIDLEDPDPGEYDRKMVELLERAIRLDPGFLQAWYRLTLHHAFGYHSVDPTQARLERARAALESAEAVDPDHPMTRLARGYYNYYGFREYERALQEFQAASEALPNEVECRKAIGYIHRRLGNFEEAVRDLEIAGELAPEDGEIPGNIASTLCALRRFEEAADYYERSLDRNPEDDGVRWRYADLAVRARGDLDGAREVLRPEPGSDPSWHAAGWCRFDLYSRDYSGAIEWAQELPTEIPLLNTVRQSLIAEATFWMKGAAGARKELESAVQSCEGFLQTSPANSPVHQTLALLHAYRGDSDAALQEARLAVDLDARDAFSGPMAQETLAQVYAVLGRDREALDLIERLLTTSYQEPITVPILELSAAWDPLRENPRFRALLETHREKMP